jgi:predicted AAA+ superfamily ATPase
MKKRFVKLPIYQKLHENLNSDIDLIQVILGPRQVGKTTTVVEYLERDYKKKALFKTTDGLLSDPYLWINEIWQEARENYDLIIIDEIQKLDNWSEHIKKLWDEDRKDGRALKCLLLGSSSLDIQKGLSESLAGRFQLIQAYHWSFSETQSLIDLSFEDYLKFGGYPGAYIFKDKPEEFISYLKTSIISSVIEKDILNNHTVKSPSLFKQAFELIMAYPAQEVSYTKLLGQLQDKGNTDLVKHYLSLYEGAFLIKSIHKYSSKELKRKTSSPKLIPLCPAFYYLTIQDDYELDERGRVFELVVGAALTRLHGELFYWREKDKEVDFILKRGRKLFAIEVKSGRRKNEKGLEAFCKKFPDTKPIFITPDNLEKLEDLLK